MCARPLTDPVAGAAAACSKRVEGRGDKNTETCTQEFFAFLHCVDHCVRFCFCSWPRGSRGWTHVVAAAAATTRQVAHTLFKHLK